MSIPRKWETAYRGGRLRASQRGEQSPRAGSLLVKSIPALSRALSFAGECTTEGLGQLIMVLGESPALSILGLMTMGCSNRFGGGNLSHPLLRRPQERER
jgi:hypothetical protein